MGFMWFESFRNFIDQNDTFVIAQDNLVRNDGIYSLYNAFIACIPDHPIIKITLERIISNVKEKNYGCNEFDITGPQVVGRAFKDFTGKTAYPNKIYNNGIKILFHKFNIYEMIGTLYYENRELCFNKPPFYYQCHSKYHTKKHYSQLYDYGKVFASMIEVSNYEKNVKNHHNTEIKKVHYAHSRPFTHSQWLNKEPRIIQSKLISPLKKIIQFYPFTLTNNKIEECISHLADLNPDIEIHIEDLDPDINLNSDEIFKFAVSKYPEFIYVPIYWYNTAPLKNIQNTSDILKLTQKENSLFDNEVKIFETPYKGFKREIKNKFNIAFE